MRKRFKDVAERIIGSYSGSKKTFKMRDICKKYGVSLPTVYLAIREIKKRGLLNIESDLNSTTKRYGVR